MATKLQLLIVEDSEDDARLFLRELQKSGYEPAWELVDTPETMKAALESRVWDVVVSDFSMPGFSGLDALRMVRESGLDIPFIIVSGKIGEDTAVEAMRNGAHDYITKGDLARLAPAIEREMVEAEVRRKKQQAESALEKARVEWEETFDAIVDPVMILDTEFRIVKANRAMADKLGLSPAETAGLICCSAVHGLEGPPPNCPHALLLSDGCPHSVEIFEPRVGGNFEVVVSPLRNSEGIVYGSVHYARDINARKQAEESLAERVKLAELSAEIGCALTTPGDLTKILNDCCQALVSHLDAAFARIWTLNSTGNVLELQASAGIYTRTDGSHNRVPVGKFKIGLIAEERMPHITNAVIGDPRVHDQEWAKREGMKAFAGHPLTVEDKLVGVMAMFSRNPFTDVTLKALAAVSNEIAIGIERKLAEKERLAHLQFAEQMDRVNLAIQRANDLEQLMSDVLDAVLTIFDCDRAWLLYPCDPEAASWSVPMERTRPEYPGANTRGLEIPMEPKSQRILRTVRATDGPVPFGPGSDCPLPEWITKQFGVQSQLTMATYPRTGKAWMFGMHQCSHARVWTQEEQRLFQEINRRLADGLTNLLFCDALKREKEFLGSLLQGSAIATFVLDPRHQVLLWNQACETLTGVKAAEVIGTSLHWRAFYSNERPCLADIVIEGRTDQLQQMYEHFSRSTLTRDGIQAEGRFSELNGSERYILFNAAPIRNSSGTMLGAIETLLDITEQKTLEAQLFHSQKMEAVGQLAGGIAHDFNNILTAIIGFSTLIEMHMNKDDPQRANLSSVLAAADRASDLTRSLLTFCRKQVNHPQPVDLNQIIRKIDTFLKRIISEDIEFRTTFLQEALTIDADSGQIEQVLMNLATNARDAMPGGGLLSIETGAVEMDDEYIKAHGYGEPGRYACIAVSDSGEGMDETTCKKVFDPFFTTKEAGKGTGLGLSIVFGIIKQHNGFINVYSKPGNGTTFRILLPLIHSAAVEKHAAIEEEVIEKGVETILVADDDAFLRDLTEKTLRMFGYTVITAVNGSDALARFKENRESIDLVILDIIMPEMNGKEAFDEMRKIDPDVKAIFVSGYTSDIIQRRGLFEEGLEFVSKPLNLKQLLLKVRAVLREGA